MFCPKCGNQIEDGSAFCPDCGAAIENNVAPVSAPQNNNQVTEEPKYIKTGKIKTLVSGLLLPVLFALQMVLSTVKVELIGIFSLLLFADLIVFIIFLKRYNSDKRNFAEYGDFEAIIKDVYAGALYKDDYIVANRDYIISANSKKQIVSTQEVLCLYEYIHKTNFVVDKVALVAVNKYGKPVEFAYRVTDRNKIPGIIVQIKLLCPQAVLGHNAQTIDYIRKNKISKK